MSFHTTIRNLDLPDVFKAAETVRGQRVRNARDTLLLEQAGQRAGSGGVATAETTKPSAEQLESASFNSDTFTQLPTAQQKAVRERAEAVGWLAGTVLDAAPGLRSARYRDALEQARSMEIPVDNLPTAYHPDLDPQLRQYREQAQSLLGSFGGRGG